MITVFIPTYNRAEWLRECLESVLTQNYPDFQVFVLNNGSTDDDATESVLLELSNKYANLYLLKRTTNDVDVTDILTHLHGDYFCFFCDDDIMLPGALSVKAKMLDENPGTGVVYSSMMCMNELGGNLGTYLSEPRFPCDMPRGAATFEALIQNNYIPLPTVMFRAELLPLWAEAQNAEMGLASDWQFLLLASQKCQFGFIHAFTAKYRLHVSQVSNTWGHVGGFSAARTAAHNYWRAQGWKG